MKVIVDMENLQEIVEGAIPKSIKTAVQEAIENIVNAYVRENFKTTIEEVVSSHMENYVRDYIHNAKITVGGGLSDNDVKEVSVENYIKSQLAEMLKTKCLIIKTKNRWGDIEEEKMSFIDFIKNEYDPSSYVQNEMKNFTRELKKDINNRIQATFNDATRASVSDAVFNVLMANDTYKQLQQSIARLTDGEN